MPRIFEKLSKVLAFIAGVILLLMMALTTADVTMRYVFNSPIPGTIEAGEMMLAAVIGLGFAYVQVTESQISVTVFSSRLPPQGQVWANGFYSLIGASVMGVMVWRITLTAMRSLRTGATYGLTNVPLAPMHSLFAFSYAMLVVALIISCVVHARRATRPLEAGK